MTNTIRVSGLTSDAKDAYYAAIAADDAWQAALDAAGIDRYSKAANGAEGSELRRLREVKIAADAKLSELTDLVRRYQDPRQIGIEMPR